eukprot:CFRG7277T1
MLARVVGIYCRAHSLPTVGYKVVGQPVRVRTLHQYTHRHIFTSNQHAISFGSFYSRSSAVLQIGQVTDPTAFLHRLGCRAKRVYCSSQKPPTSTNKPKLTASSKKRSSNISSRKVKKEKKVTLKASPRKEGEPVSGFEEVFRILGSVKKSSKKPEKGNVKNGDSFSDEAHKEASTSENVKGKASKPQGKLPPNPDPANGKKDEAETDSWLPGLVLLAAMAMFSSNQESATLSTWQEVYTEMLAHGEVLRFEVQPRHERVYVHLHPNAVVFGRKMPPGKQFYFRIASTEAFEERLAEAHKALGISHSNYVPVFYNHETSLSSTIANWLPVIFIASIPLYFLMRIRRGGAGGIGSVGGASGGPPGGGASSMFTMGRAKATVVSGETTVNVKFADVAGMDEAKQEIMEFVQFLQNPDRFTSLGAKIPRGALLVGPPGTGKTLLAKATAGESEVPFFSMAGSDFVEMFVGVGPARVRDLFAQARSRAPSIIYIDEIDAIGKARDSGGAAGGNSERENTLNQLLVEMDGFNTTEGIVVLASTNRPDTLDNALLRPGRFDRQVEVGLPDRTGRMAIFKLHMKNLTIEQDTDEQSLVDRLSALTPGFSGADIANTCNEAALRAARLGQKAVCADNFDSAIDRVVGGLEKKTMVMDPKEKTVVAHHEAGHAVLGWVLEHTETILKVSIVPRSKHVMGHSQSLPNDQKLYTTEQIFDRMCQILGGRIAEVLIFGKTSTSATDDLQKVTQLAYKQVTLWGMNKAIGPLSFQNPEAGDYRLRVYSDHMQNKVDVEVSKLVNEASQRATEIMTKNQHLVIKVAEELLAKETLHYTELVALLGQPPFPKKSPYEIK